MLALFLIAQISPPTTTVLKASASSGGGGFSLPIVVTVVVGILGVAGVVAAAFAVIRSNLAQTTIALYREESNALRQRNETLEEERDDALKERDAEVNKRTSAEKALADMKDMVTGTSAIKELSKNVQEQHREITAAVRQQHHDMSEVTEAQHEETMGAFDTLAAGLAAWATTGKAPPPKISNGGTE